MHPRFQTRLDGIQAARAGSITEYKERLVADLCIVQAAAAALPKGTFEAPEKVHKHLEDVLSVLRGTESDEFEAWSRMVPLIEQTTQLSEMILHLVHMNAASNQLPSEADVVEGRAIGDSAQALNRE